MTCILDFYARREAIRSAAISSHDAAHDDVILGAWALESIILATPAMNIDEFKIKLSLWDELVADPACILDDHVSYWVQMKKDMFAMIEQAGLLHAVTAARAS